MLKQILFFVLFCNPVIGTFMNFEKESSNVGEVLLRAFGGPFAAVSPEDEISPLCRQHSTMYLQSLSNFTAWAINMYDSSTHIPSSMVMGNIQQLGNFDQCLGIETAFFRGKQCRATFQFAIGGFSKFSKYTNLLTNDVQKQLGMSDLFYAVADAAGVSWTSPRSALYTWAFCVPSSCSASDVESALNNALAPLNQPDRIEVMVNVGDADCHGETSAEITGVDIGMIILLAVTAVLLIGSTCYDIIVHWNKPETKKKSTRHEVLMSFSVRENCRKLFSTASGGDTMHCLNGLRFLSIFWIMLGHTFYMKSISPSVNQIAVKDYDQNVSMMLIMNGTLTTDTFFLLGGLLLCYTFMRYWEKNPSFNAISFYLQRYIRLTPPYAFVIFFYASLMYHLGSGPMWNQWVGVNRDYCLANWWTNLLYINNYVNVGEMCLNQTWYLAVDMQLFWVSPLILYPLARWPRFGKGLLATLTFVSVVIPFAITFAQNLTAAMLYTKDPIIVGVVYVQVYTRTYARAGPYLIGIALGYLLYKLKNKSIKIHAVWVTLGWIVAVGSCVTVVLSAAIFYDDGHSYNAVESSLYAGLHRSVWAIGIGWIAFACIKGYGGFVDSLLSWKLFTPLSRLTYSAYLCHYIVLLVNIGSTRAPAYLTQYSVIHEFAGNLLIVMVLSTVLCLAYEMPFLNLNNLFVKRTRKVIEPKENGGRKYSMEGPLSPPNSENDSIEETRATVYIISENIQELNSPESAHVRMELRSYENAGFEDQR